jgi:hypothetical protein
MPKTKRPVQSSELAQQIADWKDKPEISGLTSGAATLNLLNHAVSAAFLGPDPSPKLQE